MYLLKNDEVNSNFYKQIAKRFQIGINAVSIIYTYVKCIYIYFLKFEQMSYMSTEYMIQDIHI